MRRLVFQLFDTSPCLDGLFGRDGGLQISAVPLMTTAMSSTKSPSGCFSSHGSSITSTPILLRASTSSSCSLLALSMFMPWPRIRSYEDDSANELATRETSAKLYLKQLESVVMARSYDGSRRIQEKSVKLIFFSVHKTQTGSQIFYLPLKNY